jgi:hypothetical protein
MEMNWKLLSASCVGLFLVACDGKKEEKKADEATPPPAAAKLEDHKPAETTPADAPKEEPKKEEHKAS